MVSTARIPILGFVAYSGTGKTTLLLKIIPLLKAQGLRIGMVKHTHHQFDIDHPGKDSYRLRQAGVDQTLVASSQRWALMVETGQFSEAHLDQVLSHLDQDQLDLILVEGFKHESFPKIEVHRPSLDRPPLFLQDKSVVAIACDAPLSVPTDLPILDLNNSLEIIEFIQKQFLGG
jgi:molybdopterin-guanine dinucleotide biosynthesis protein MobB